MVPRQPGDLGAIRVEPRVGIEITPGDKDCLFPAGEINTDQAIHRFLSRRPVIFAHADQMLALGVNNGVGIAQPAFRGQGLGGGRSCLTIQPLIREI